MLVTHFGICFNEINEYQKTCTHIRTQSGIDASLVIIFVIKYMLSIVRHLHEYIHVT